MRTLSLQPITAHLLAAYTDIRGLEIIPAADAMLHMCPWLRSIIPGRNCCAITIGAIELIFIVRSMSLTLCWSNVLLLATIPAQFIRMSTLPHSLVVIRATFSTWSLSDTSSLYPITLPIFLNSLIVDAMLSSLMSQIIRHLAPFSSAIRPIILPIPDAPPVIRTQLPLILVIIVMFLRKLCLFVLLGVQK